MADDPQTPTPPSPDGSPANPLSVTIANPAVLPGGSVLPTPGIDEAPEGGAYRHSRSLDGRDPQWVNANGDPIKTPKEKS
jgi:hypothetical protein